MFKKHTHCSWCGQAFAEAQTWPRTCLHCQNITFLNPIPVAVVLVPVDEGLLLIRRAIDPARGKLALPGGYINLGESWQEAGAREVFEETGLIIEPEEIQEFGVRSAPDGTILIFGLAQPRASAGLPPFTPTPETTERLVGKPLPDELAFPLHAEAMAAFFQQA